MNALLNKLTRSLMLVPAFPPPLAEQINRAIQEDETVEHRIRYERKVRDKEALRQREAGRVVLLCEIELTRLHRQLETLRKAFLDEFEAWMGQEPFPEMEPHPIARDRARTLAFRLSTLAAFLVETYIGNYLFTNLELGPLESAFAALLFSAGAMVLADGGLLAFSDSDSPRESRDRLLQVIKPAFKAVAICAIAILLWRVIRTPWLADLLWPLVSLGIFTISIGLIPLGGGFLAAADLYGWSARHTAAYRRLDEERVRTEGIRQKYLTCLPRTRDGAYTILELHQQPVQRLSRPPINITPLLAALCIVGSLLASACGGQQAGRRGAATFAKPIKQPAPTLTPLLNENSAELHLLLDRSGSLHADAAAAAARNMSEQLPGWIEAMSATRLTVESFAADGLSATELVSMPLPQRRAVRRENLAECAAKRGDIGDAPVVERLREEQCRQAIERYETQAAEEYRAALRQSLGQLTPETLNPPVAPATPCTDLYGVMYRIAALRRPGRHRYVVLTDGRNTCGPLRPLRAPAGDVRVLVLLAPAKAKESRGQRSVDQFESVKAALHKAAPWLDITLSAERNLAHYFDAKNAPDQLQP